MVDTEHDDLPPAQVSRLKRVSGLWLIPLVTALVGAAMIYDNWAGQGERIRITFTTAAGLEAGRTLIKTQDVEVGIVEDITLNATLDGVLVGARIYDEFRDLLVEGSRFWVVEPTITLSGVSGLNTLITGQYINFAPAESGQPSDTFEGLEQPPVTPAGTPGLHITLSAGDDYAFRRGEVIQHQGIAVGKVEDLRLDFANGVVYYDAFIEAPYHTLVTSNTRFWKNSAVRAELSTDGFELETGTVGNIVAGGISFATPEGDMPGEAPDEDLVFYVYPNSNAIYERQFDYALNYWVMVADSISGLSVDAPVMHRGVRIGRVMRTDYIPEGRNLLDRSLAIPVLIEINPGRLGMPDTPAGLQRARADVETWIGQGLQATVKVRNLLLGQQMIELGYDTPPENPVQPERFLELTVIPTDQDSIAKFATSIEDLIAKLNALPVESLLSRIESLADEASATLAELRAFAASGEEFLAADRNEEVLQQLSRTLTAAEQLMDSYSADSATSRDLGDALAALTALAEELRPLAVELKNRPSSLVFPGRRADELQPERKQP